jgi:hypothetical protein
VFVRVDFDEEIGLLCSLGFDDVDYDDKAVLAAVRDAPAGGVAAVAFEMPWMRADMVVLLSRGSRTGETSRTW